MFGPLRQPFPLDHELLGQDGNVEAELITQQFDQTLLRQDQRNVVDRWAIVHVDNLLKRLDSRFNKSFGFTLIGSHSQFDLLYGEITRCCIKSIY